MLSKRCRSAVLAGALVVLGTNCASAGTLERCKQLIGTTREDAGASGFDSPYYRDVDEGYRACRGAQLPVLIRARAIARYAAAQAARGHAQNAIETYREAVTVIGTPSDAGTRAVLIDILENTAAVEASIALRDAAIADAERAASLRSTAYGAESVEAAIGMMKLGLIYGDLRDYAKSEAVIRQSLRIAQKACGECTAVAEIYSALSALYAAQGREDEARQYDTLAARIYSEQ